MSKQTPWSSGVQLAKARFKCGYCAKWRTGAFRWVDGERSCSRCNREEDPPHKVEHSVTCPLCHGEGVLREEE